MNTEDQNEPLSHSTSSSIEESIHEEESQDSKYLTESELEELDEPTPKPRSVSYQGQDLDVEGLVRRLDRGDIVIPSFGASNDDIETASFQRGFVWRRAQMDKFIESLLLGYPIPGIFLVRQQDGRMLVLDGQQRLKTLHAFYKGLPNSTGRVTDEKSTFKPSETSSDAEAPEANLTEYKLESVSDDYRGVTYKTLSEAQRRNLNNTFIQATIVTAWPDGDNTSAIYQIFERLNSGGTQLTAHEIRVALYAGPFIDFLEELNQNSHWRILYGKKNSRMRDQELILRILALFVDSDYYTRPLRGFLNQFADKNRNKVQPEVLDAGDLFLKSSMLLADTFGKDALRSRSHQVNNPWTDGLFYGIMKRLAQGHEISKKELEVRFNKLRESEEFKLNYTGASADENQVKNRLRIAEELFRLQ